MLPGKVTQAQTISFITRAVVVKGYWERQPNNAALYPAPGLLRAPQRPGD